MRERIRFESELSDLALRDTRFDRETKVSATVGHTFWTKSVLNRLSSASLTLDNKLDERFRTALGEFQRANNIEPTSKVDFRTERILLEKNALFGLSESDKSKRDVITQAQSKIEDWTAKAIIPVHKKHLILQQFRDPRTITSLVLH